MGIKNIHSENASLIFSRYLRSKGLRQTPERFAILSEIYLSNTRFDLKTLRERLAQKRFPVSRGTLYNTIDLLLECNLIRCFHIEEGKTFFEKANSNSRHDYLILTDTKEILEFSEDQIMDIQKQIEQTFNVEIHDHSLIFYGKRK